MARVYGWIIGKIDRNYKLVDNFAKEIKAVKENENYRNSIIEAQYKEVSSKYTLDIVVNKYIEAYEKAISIGK